MTHYVEHEGKARHGHGRHRYLLSDYGFTNADIERDFGAYIERYRIPREA
jgi:hypothetical protein